MRWKWYYHNGGYAVRSRKKSDGPGTSKVRMQRVIAERAGMQIVGLETDHVDQNKLNNQIANLRPATIRQNQGNRMALANNTSGFKGVSWNKQSQRWRTVIRVNYRPVHIGYFDDKYEAARAYNEAATKYHGEFAWLNMGE